MEPVMVEHLHRVTFNTERPYTPRGQIVTAVLVKVEGYYALIFKDHSRMIWAPILRFPEELLEDMGGYDPDCVQYDVMYSYDRGEYGWTSFEGQATEVTRAHLCRIHDHLQRLARDLKE